MKYLLAFSLGTLLLWSSCKEDDTQPVPSTETTKTSLLTNAEWRLDEGTINPSIDVEVVPGTTITVNSYWDLLAYAGGGQVLECDKDNRMICKTDSSVVMDEGPTKCDSGDPQTTDGGKWNFEESETKLKFSSFPQDPTGEPRTLNIDMLSGTNLNLTMSYAFKNPITGDTTFHAIVMKYSNQKGK